MDDDEKNGPVKDTAACVIVFWQDGRYESFPPDTTAEFSIHCDTILLRWNQSDDKKYRCIPLRGVRWIGNSTPESVRLL